MSKEQLPDPLRERIDAILREHQTVVFMKGHRAMPQCGFSAQVVQVLDQLGRDFHEVNILADADLRQAMKIYTDWPTFPQIYHRGTFIGGCDIVVAMHAKGELEQVLGS